MSRTLVCLLLVACGHPGNGNGTDGGHADGGGDDGGPLDDGSHDSGSTDGSGSGSSTAITTCDANHWLAPISIAGPGIMRFHGKTYVFAQSGTVWAVVDHATGVATTQAIPLPAGVAVMKAVKTELALDGKPLVWFLNSDNHYFATRFDGSAFSTPIDLAGASTIHGDASGNVYAYGSTGLVEYAPAGGSIARGTFPISSSEVLGWNVGTDGTVYLMQHVRRPSTIHSGDQADDMKLLHPTATSRGTPESVLG